MYKLLQEVRVSAVNSMGLIGRCIAQLCMLRDTSSPRMVHISMCAIASHNSVVLCVSWLLAAM